eukprot:7210583-Pyramimonas_sp.AAC.1
MVAARCLRARIREGAPAVRMSGIGRAALQSRAPVRIECRVHGCRGDVLASRAPGAAVYGGIRYAPYRRK